MKKFETTLKAFCNFIKLESRIQTILIKRKVKLQVNFKNNFIRPLSAIKDSIPNEISNLK